MIRLCYILIVTSCAFSSKGQPIDDGSGCSLEEDPDTEYWCMGRGWQRECSQRVPTGTRVLTKCRSDFYYEGHEQTDLMHCNSGTWNREVPTCSLQCGIALSIMPIIINGTSAKIENLPWHSAIYSKDFSPYQQICGGSLISRTVIVSAAHCFWDDTAHQLPADRFAAGLGKIYRPWNEEHDFHAQKFDIQEIKIPPRFRGATTRFQDDIALVLLAGEVELSAFVLPVCLDFQGGQLEDGSLGMVAGWGLTSEDGKASPVLKVTELPYVEINRCFSESSLAMHSLITSDKMCAGYLRAPSSTVCRGDSGGGLVFEERGVQYLRGVVSSAPRSEHDCTSNVYVFLTQLSFHREFIEDQLAAWT